jgi:hypothetical protein
LRDQTKQSLLYAAGAIFLGLVGLASGDFTTAWQHVGPNAPFRVPVAYLTASIELAAGLVLLWRRTARAGAQTLTVVYSVFTLVRVPKALLDSLRDFDARSSLLRSFGTGVSGPMSVLADENVWSRSTARLQV